MLAAAVVVVAGGIFWFMSGSDVPDTPVETIGTPSFSEADVVFDEVAVPAESVDVDALVDEARLARDAGQLFNPAGNNAIELFASALDADPDNAIISAELDAAILQALSMAETAILESRLDDTEAALQRVMAVEPQNTRLPFLNAQLSQMQLRARLDEARLAIRENRFEDAATELGAARNLNVSDFTEINAVAAELGAARSEQQVDEVLAKAAAKLDAGNLLSPANDNARYYYELVLSNDAENTAARQGLSAIAGKLAFQARTEIDNGDLAVAEDILSDAHALDPSNNEVKSIVTALANERAAIDRLRRDEIERIAASEQKAAAEREAETERLAEAERLAALEPPATNDGVADPIDDSMGDASVATTDLRPIAMSSLSRVKYVAPKYPRSAQRRNLSGWVDVVFTVTTEGTVEDIQIPNSEPGTTFVNAAVKAVEKWEFEPVAENGVLVSKRAGVRMMFALE
jgi:TonB family protein